MEEDTVEGMSIPLRELTEEEISRPITLERFQHFHYQAGEDFLDQIGSVNNARIALQFCGFAIAKHPEWNKELLDSCNKIYTSDVYTQLVQNVYRDYNDNDDDLFYTDFAEFLNLTEHAKKRVNQVLIQVDEYYKN